MIALPQVALYGGSFDPVHNAHLQLLRSTIDAIAPETLIVLPCHQPPHKDGLMADTTSRLSMLKLALQTLPQVKIDQRELRRNALSYTYHTVREYRQELGEASSLIFVIGEDSWLDFTSWFRWKELFEYINLLVLKRPLAVQQEGLAMSHKVLTEYLADNEVIANDLKFFAHGKIAMLENEPLDIASSNIRSLVGQSDCSYCKLVPSNVANYIKFNGLYSQK